MYFVLHLLNQKPRRFKDSLTILPQGLYDQQNACKLPQF